MEPHPFSEIFPSMTPDEYRELSSDIARNGLLEPITLYNGMILDGRNRHFICHGLDIKIKTVEFTPREGLLQFKSADEQALDFVISKNLHRRHLNAGQRAMIALNMLPHFKEINKKKHQFGSSNGGLESGNVRADRESKVVPNSVQPSSMDEPKKSVEQAGESVGVGKTSVITAQNLAQQAPDLAEQVKCGTTSLNAASEQLAARNGKPHKPFNTDKSWKKIQKLLDLWPDEFSVLLQDYMHEWLNNH